MERLIIPGSAPSVNHQYRNVFANGRRMRVLTNGAEKWSDSAVILANHWRQRNHWETVQGKVIVKLWFFFPNRQKKDTHNCLKILLDCLEDALIYENDQYAFPWVMDFEVDKENPRIEIEFEAME